MSDEHFPEEANLSKRERQKLRRQRKIEAERQAAKQAKAKRGLATVLVVALVVGAVGLFGVNWWMDRQETQRLIADAEERLEELGCTPVQEQAIAQSPHLSGEQLTSSPPEVIYPDRPATSGPHVGQVVQSGFFDQVIDERFLIHNLEHGYVHIHFSEDADPGDVADIEAFVEDQIGARTEKVIASRWKADMPDGANYALTAWGARQLCEQWDRGVALGFIGDYHYLEGTAPEKDLRPHRGGTSGGGIDPSEEDGDLLLPPLAELSDLDMEDVMEEPEDVEEDPTADGQAEDTDEDADADADADS